ncbi:polysaccharide lyase family 1 protein [Schizophyllum commune H4-8]|nr:polysaccharide lyase family 1 protein [Schizophyllum commune H4-8]KAI5888645.1 polysaccharide lyase family 1 protein [Schizophyllum commune H4-8]
MALFTFLGLLASLCTYVIGLQVYDGPTPDLSSTPFGYAQASTGGSTNESAVYVASTLAELKEAVELPYTKTVYVNGTIHGNELADGSLADCQTYIDTTGSDGSAVRQFNFTLYILSLNSTYTSLVDAAAEAGEPFEGRNATEYKELLGHQNGWRPVVVGTQKAQVGLRLTNNMSIIGLDKSAALDGVNLYLSSVDNVWVRNLKLVSPADCFPAPETFPSSWNAEFDAVGLVTSTNVWVDGCELQDQLSGEYVVPDEIDGWQVDRFDGKLECLFDCEDGTDNVTFSHNIIRNHHKSLLIGGGTKEADRDLGKMHFTIFGNHFNNSASRNPLMRFGTFDIANNLYSYTNDAEPLFDTDTTANTTDYLTSRAAAPADAVFQYNLGVYNQSTVHVRANAFMASGAHADDASRLFTISEATLPDRPARVCVDAGVESTLNGGAVNLADVAGATVDYFVEEGRAVEGAVLVTCEGVVEEGYELPVTLTNGKDVEEYVLANAGQV